MRHHRRQRFSLGLVVAIVVLVGDQLAKWAILAAFRPPGIEVTPFAAAAPIQVLPILDFELVWNRGVSFGLGNTQGGWNMLIFAALSTVIALVLLVWMARAQRVVLILALGFVVGGALGNLVDRLRFGAVVDFIYIHVGAFDWFPAFNVADSAITAGAVLLAIDSLFNGRD
jgi:signal peptidase II